MEPDPGGSLPARILAHLHAAYPARMELADIVRAVDTGKGTTAAAVSVMLMRLAKEGKATKENDRWVAVIGEARS